MVSLRRRRYLGLSNGRNSFTLDLSKLNENGKSVQNQNQNQNQNQSSSSSVKPLSWSPLPPVISSHLPLVIKSESKPGPSSVPISTVPKEEPTSQSGQYYPGKEIKRRKRHRRKQYEDQEPCVMRGVYFKNMKWQAAIKVDKKQIHLGTVGSQEEAAHLYDRAAFMCGREPNFELTEEEKEELRKFTWEDFLEMTRNNINNKKQQRKFGGSRRKKLEMEVQSDMGGSSQSDGTDPDAPAS